MKMIIMDYFIVGVGVVGMVFVDVLFFEIEYEMVIVDCYVKFGGYWNIVYLFVMLYQLLVFYGVSLYELFKGWIDVVGFNKGLYELVFGMEVSVYFDDVMCYYFQLLGWVEYFLMCLVKLFEGKIGGEEVVCQLILGGELFCVKVCKCVVDVIYFKMMVLVNYKLSFMIEEGVCFVFVNDLLCFKEVLEGYVVIGGGKIGIDVCFWFLQNGVDFDQICWIMLCDGWMFDCQNMQFGDDFFEYMIGVFV